MRFGERCYTQVILEAGITNVVRVKLREGFRSGVQVDAPTDSALTV